VNTFGDADATGVGAKQWPAVVSVPSRDTGIPLENTFPLPLAITSPQLTGSPILIIAGIFSPYYPYLAKYQAKETLYV
jgi:hypothetical protein